MDESLIAKGLTEVFNQRGQFIVLGLTGRTGSGCTTAATLLSKEFASLGLEPVASPLTTMDQRKHRVIYAYARENWQSFVQVSVTLVIVTFILDADPSLLDSKLREWISDDMKRSELMAAIANSTKKWDHIKSIVTRGEQRKKLTEADAYLNFVKADLEPLLLKLKHGLGGNYSKAFQAFGDNLRASGSILDASFNSAALFALPIRVGEIVVAIRELQLSRDKPARIVIDALRNPFEVEYYRHRFASFLLIAVTTPDLDRRTRLIEQLNLNVTDIEALDAKEYPAENKPLSGIKQFVSQNIQACLEKADIFLSNPGEAKRGQTLDLKQMARGLATFVSLIQHPGLITPSKTERCMQIAYSARANSGCISRQVGATITDENYSIKAVGWNDVPAGQVPCLYRKATDLLIAADNEGFSDYELKDQAFRSQIEGRYRTFAIALTGGRSVAYCFKSEYNALKASKMRGNQVHTRSLHAEENAFLQLSKNGGTGIEGGILFSTASPCELCSKKAFQLGIGRIVYIDPYPGISLTHILGAGPQQKRPTLELFSGAVGQAFHRLYDPLLPYKDECEVFLRSGGE